MVAFTKFAIHMGFLSQMLLFQYVNLIDEGPGLVSSTHTPIDLRTHCVLMWMYRGRVQEASEGPSDTSRTSSPRS